MRNGVQPDIQPDVRPERSTTRRVVNAALRVFSKEGLTATTREIAREAGVNEVTLFRQFATKENLITAATREMCRMQLQVLNQLDLNDFDLVRDLSRIARAYDAATTRHMGFIIALLSLPHQPELSDQLTREIIQPLRSKFLAYLEEAVNRGLVRDIDMAPAVDAFTGMIFAGALRRHVKKRRYSRQRYLDSCVALFCEGIVAKCK